MHVQSRQIIIVSTFYTPPSHTHTHTHTGAQPVTLRVCPNCEESCHIRCKKCPECEDEFPPSTKSRAKPDQDIVENSSNLLQILQKKVTIQYTLYTVYMYLHWVRPRKLCGQLWLHLCFMWWTSMPGTTSTWKMLTFSWLELTAYR